MHASPERLLVRSGTLLFAEGDPGAVAYLIERGRVSLFADDREGKRMIGERGPGDLAGELAIVEEGLRGMSALALTDCELLVITRDQISRRFEDIDPLLRVCLGAIIGHCRAAAFERGASQRAVSDAAAEWPNATAARNILSLEHQLRKAIRNDELVLHFQPIVRLASRQLVGFEALLRWRHPERGLLLPNDFVPLAESSDIIRDITTWCLTRVGAQFPALMAASARSGSGGPPFVSVNVSGADLLHPEFAEKAAGIIGAAGIDPRHIRLEVTESVLMREADQCARTLAECRARGMQIAIDDFGTGYSSLNYLNVFPVGIIKIDRSFARALLAGQQGRKIMAAILSLGLDLGLTAIAEGIESEREAEILAAMGCELGQGYLFGHPKPLRETVDLIRGWTSETAEQEVAAPQVRWG